MESFAIVLTQGWPLALVICVALIVFGFIWFLRKVHNEEQTVKDLRHQLEKQITTIEHHPGKH